MFEGILSNIKTHSGKVSEILNFENLRQGTASLSDNFDSLKTQTTRLSVSIVTKLKKNRPFIIYWYIKVMNHRPAVYMQLKMSKKNVN